jgi:hypothetical protein
MMICVVDLFYKALNFTKKKIKIMKPFLYIYIYILYYFKNKTIMIN